MTRFSRVFLAVLLFGVAFAVTINTTSASAEASEAEGWLVTSNGIVQTVGAAQFFGDLEGVQLNAPIVAIAPTATGLGYILTATDGGIFAFGDAGFYGSTGGIVLNRPIVGAAMTPTGKGYWLAASDGGIFAFGDAKFFGSTGSMNLNSPITGISPDPSGEGYILVAQDGGIFAFGNARFYGSTGDISLNSPIVGIAMNDNADGYWLVAKDGGIFAFGAAAFMGSTGALDLESPVTGMALSESGDGYQIFTADGRIHGFGDAPSNDTPSEGGAVTSVSGKPRKPKKNDNENKGGGSGASTTTLGNPTTTLLDPTTTSGVTTTTLLDPTTTLLDPTTTSGVTTTVGPTTTTSSGNAYGAPLDLGTNDITKYFELPGDQIVVVPNGVYKAKEITKIRNATAGPYGGWLILVAETPGGVIIDQTPNGPSNAQGIHEFGSLNLDHNGSSSARVVISGFHFQDGIFMIDADDVTLWYTTHTFSAEEWASQPNWPGGNPPAMQNETPRTIFVLYGADRFSAYGTDIYHTGTGIRFVGRSDDSIIQGFHLSGLDHAGANLGRLHGTTPPPWWDQWVIDHQGSGDNWYNGAIGKINQYAATNEWMGYDPRDRLHGSAIGNATGGTRRLQILDSFFDGNSRAGNPGGTDETSKPWSISVNKFDVVDLRIDNIWIHNLDSAQFRNMQKTHTAGNSLNGTVSNVWTWGCGSYCRTDTFQTVDGIITYDSGISKWNNPPYPDQLNVPTTNWNDLGQNAAAPTGPDPATAWRNTPGNTYDDMISFLGL